MYLPKELVSAVVDTAACLICADDAEGRLVLFNRRCEELTGYTFDEIRELGTASLVPPEELPAVKAVADAYRSGEQPIRHENHWICKNGARRLIAWTNTVVTEANGAAFVVATGVDVTEERRAEAALRESEERFRAMADSAPVLMWMSDADGKPLFFNRGWHEFTGLSFDEEIGAGGWVGIHEDDGGAAHVLYGQAVDEHAPYEAEYRLRRADGQYRHIRDRAVPRFLADGTFAGLTGVAVDVTDQRDVEQVLRESEEHLRAVLDNEPALVWMTDENAVASFFNRGWLEFTGRTLEDQLGRGWEEVTHPDDLSLVLGAYEVAFGGRTGYELEYRLLRHDGEWRWVLERANPRLDAEGRFIGLTGTTFDITDQREAEHALKVSEARLQHVFDLTPAIIWMTDPDGQVTFFSRSGLEFVGGTLEESLGRSWLFAVHPQDLPLVLERWDGAIAAQTEYEFEFRLRRRDGQYRWVFDQGKPHYDADGRFAGLTGATFDITERKEIEEALRESEERFRQLADNVDDVFWLADPSGTRLLYLNSAFEHVWGRPRKAFLADPELFAEYVHPDDRAAQLARLSRLPQEEYDAQYRIVRPDGSIRWIRDRSFHVHDEQGEVVRVAGIAIDVTEVKQANEERRALEEQMRHAQKLESLGVLAGGIAHDFNNLLTGILGNAGLALAELPAHSPARATVEKIETAALRTAELTNQMLAYAGKGRFLVTPIDLSQLVEEMAHLLSAAISKKALLRYELDGELPAVEGDATQLRQVVMNLITNASDALRDESGVIAVRTGVMDADRRYLTGASAGEALDEGPYVFVEVADTGVGMDEETKQRIFDPFFTTKFTGRGLGLAGTLGIVRGHGGAITVESKPGEGTTARVVLPPGERRVAADPAAGAAPAEALAAGGTVLVVDDDEAVRSVARITLERAGFAVLTAADGREALEVFGAHAHEIAAVLLDLTMPVMGGDEVLRELRAARAAVPVVLSSGYTEEDATTRLDGNGVAGFVQKPYRPAELTAKVLEALGR